MSLESQEPRGVPHWIDEALDAPLVRKARETVAAVAAFTRSPRQFSARWARGEVATNPLLLMIAAVSATTPIRQLADRFTGNEPPGLLDSFIVSLSPFAYYAALATVAHALLWALGARGPLRGTVGVSLFAGAGPGALVTVAMQLMGVALYQRYGTINFLDAVVPHPLSLVGMATLLSLLGGMFASLVFGISGVSNVSRPTAAFAVVVAVVLAGWALEPYGGYCSFAHLAGRAWHDERGWHVHGGFRS